MRRRRYQPSAPGRPQPGVVIDRGRAWFCLWTAPRAGEKVAAPLREAGLGVYVPVEALSRVRRGKAVAVERPVLGRYVLVGLTAARPEWSAVQDALSGPCRAVLGKVLTTAEGDPVQVPASILQCFADGLGRSLAGVLGSGLFCTGQPVKAVHGPLEGILGAFLDQDDSRIRALFNLLGRQTLVAFKPGQLEAA